MAAVAPRASRTAAALLAAMTGIAAEVGVVAVVGIQGPCTFSSCGPTAAANSPHLPGVQYRLVSNETTLGRLLLHGR